MSEKQEESPLAGDPGMEPLLDGEALFGDLGPEPEATVAPLVEINDEGSAQDLGTPIEDELGTKESSSVVPRIVSVLLTIAALALLGFGLFYFFAGDLVTQRGAPGAFKLEDVVPFEDVRIESMRASVYPRGDGGLMLVVMGEAVNQGTEERSEVDVVAVFGDGSGTAVAEVRAPLGIPLTPPEFLGLESQKDVDNAFAKRLSEGEWKLKAGEPLVYTAVLFDPPKPANELSPIVKLERAIERKVKLPEYEGPPESLAIPPEELNKKGKRKRKGKRRGKRRRKKAE